MSPTITDIDVVSFRFTLEDVGPYATGFKAAYEPGTTTDRELFAVKVHTDTEHTGEYVVGYSPTFAAEQIRLFADYLIGRDPLDRERHWSEINRALRQYDRMGMGPVDIALWDFAGKYHDAPIHELLGSYRDRLPAYASTYVGDDSGGLDSPEAYADFAEECLARGYSAYKIHTWGGSDAERDIDREIATVRAVGERVGDEMDLMLDPSCEYETFADALAVGRACDEHGYYWYEDPYSDGGMSAFGHRRLRERLDTPLLQTEHVRSVEMHADFALAEATDLLRADPEYDGGITGCMKIARVAEGLGLDVGYHAPGPAQRHCMAATRNTNYYELGLVHPECALNKPQFYTNDYGDELGAVEPDGTVSVPDGPGLGVEYDWDEIERNQVRSYV